jgi:hypothetical protein
MSSRPTATNYLVFLVAKCMACSDSAVISASYISHAPSRLEQVVSFTVESLPRSRFWVSLRISGVGLAGTPK